MLHHEVNERKEQYCPGALPVERSPEPLQTPGFQGWVRGLVIAASGRFFDFRVGTVGLGHIVWHSVDVGPGHYFSFCPWWLVLLQTDISQTRRVNARWVALTRAAHHGAPAAAPQMMKP